MKAELIIRLLPAFLVFFPLLAAAMAADRLISRVLARRTGGPVLQPLFDIVKMFSKDIDMPQEKKFIFLSMPVVTLAAYVSVFALTAIGSAADIHILFILSLFFIPSFTVFRASFFGRGRGMSPYRLLSGGVFYEVLFIALLSGPILISGPLSVSGSAVKFSGSYFPFVLSQLPALSAVVFLLAFKVNNWAAFRMGASAAPGSLSAYSGLPLAFWALSYWAGIVSASAAAAAVFFGFDAASGVSGFLIFLSKTVIIILAVLVLKNTVPLLKPADAERICARYIFPVAVLQIAADLFIG